MALPEVVRRHAEKELAAFCERSLPANARDQVRLEFEIRGSAVTLVERRRPWRSDGESENWTRMPIAKFRFDTASALWALFWPDQNRRWHEDNAYPTPDLSELLDTVDRDPTGIYWG